MFFLAQARQAKHLAVGFFAQYVHHGVYREAPHQAIGTIHHRRGNEIVALERRGGVGRVIGWFEAGDLFFHGVADVAVGIEHHHTLQRQAAEQMIVVVNHKQLIGVIRQLAKAAQIAHRRFDADIRPHRDNFKVHRRADGLVGIGQRRLHAGAILRIEAFQHILNDIARQVRRQVRQLVGIELLCRGDQLARIHACDQGLAHRIGDFQQNLAVALGFN